MADNFLEQRMEDYRRGALKYRVSRRKPELAAFVVDGLSEQGTAHVRRLRASGLYNVGFCGKNTSAGSKLAQSAGARFYPVDPTDADAVEDAIADATARWGRMDTILK